MRAREHYWDAVRSALMLLGIPYHVALDYRPQAMWMIPVDEVAPMMGVIVAVIHMFRMPAFFLVAGYFTALLLLRQDGGTWLRRRYARLGIPFVAGLVVILPVLNLLAAILRHDGAAGLHALYPSPESGLRHLWFIVVLLDMQTIVAALCAVRPRLRLAWVPPAIDHWIARHFLLSGLVTAAAISLYAVLIVRVAHRLLLDAAVAEGLFRIVDLATYAPYFCTGILLQRSPQALRAFTTVRPAIIAVALLAIGASLRTHHFQSLAAIASTQVIVATAKRHASHPRQWIRSLVDASFVIYLVHMPIVIALAILWQRLHWSPWTEFTLGSLLTLLLSYAIWRGGRRSRILCWLFGGIPLPASDPPGIARAAPAAPVMTDRV